MLDYFASFHYHFSLLETVGEGIGEVLQLLGSQVQEKGEVDSHLCFSFYYQF